MRTVVLLLAAIMTMALASQASAQQDACAKGYAQCMDRCVTRPASAQASCGQTCEVSSNRCYEKIYGPPPQNGDAGGAAAAAPAPAQNATEADDARGQAAPDAGARKGGPK